MNTASAAMTPGAGGRRAEVDFVDNNTTHPPFNWPHLRSQTPPLGTNYGGDNYAGQGKVNGPLLESMRPLKPEGQLWGGGGGQINGAIGIF